MLVMPTKSVSLETWNPGQSGLIVPVAVVEACSWKNNVLASQQMY